MQFAVRITKGDGETDLKSFDTPKDARRRYARARGLLRLAVGSPLPVPEARLPDVARSLEEEFGAESIERIELHKCDAADARSAAHAVEHGESTILEWGDAEDPYASDTEALLKELGI